MSDPALNEQLIAAAYENDVEAARRLMEQGADVNAKDETVQSAYLVATSEVGDDPSLLELALANGADVSSLDSYDGTGLIRAADRGYTEVVARLLETDIDVDHVNRLGLDRAARGDHSRWRRCGAHGGRSVTDRSGRGREHRRQPWRDAARPRPRERLRGHGRAPARGRRAVVAEARPRLAAATYTDQALSVRARTRAPQSSSASTSVTWPSFRPARGVLP